jgi:energy-converting hydrogenase Eha subunit E
MFLLSVQLDIVGELDSLRIPPPTEPAVFPMNTQLATVGVLLLPLAMPPPKESDTFSVNVQWITVGSLE